MSRLVKLARKGPDLTQKMARCEPWVAREACWNIPLDVLEEDERMWKIRKIQIEAKELYWREKVNDEDAERALEHWRWPTIRPPIVVVAASAGRYMPLRTDSAWASAMNSSVQHAWADAKSDSIRRGTVNTDKSWIVEHRKDEEMAAKNTMKKIAEIAMKSVDANNEKKATQIIERCQRAWKENDDLEGDGRIATPKLKPVRNDEDSNMVMMWAFKITGPEVLLAGHALETEAIEGIWRQQGEQISDEKVVARTTLVMTIEKMGNYGRLLEDNIPIGTRRYTINKALRTITQWVSQITQIDGTKK